MNENERCGESAHGEESYGSGALGANAIGGVQGSIGSAPSNDQPVQVRPTPSVFQLAEQCGADLDGGDVPDYQSGFSGSHPTITFTERQLERFASMLHSELASVPDGWVLVPREPTATMWAAAIFASCEAEEIYVGNCPAVAWDRFRLRTNRIRHVFDALLNAAQPRRRQGDAP